MAMSGSARRSVPFQVAADAGTTPFWYQGCAKMWLTPPPEPPRKLPGALGFQACPFQSELVEPQPASHVRWPKRPIPSAVPPTDVTHGLESGKPTDFSPIASRRSPLSPDAKYTPMPSAAACLNMSLSELISPCDAHASGSPQLLEMMLARCPSMAALSAWSRPAASLAAPT